MNDIIFNWLKGYPGMELLQWQQVEAVDGGCGLFFRGSTVREAQKDLLGRAKIRKTLHFRICRYGSSGDNLVFFTMLGPWVELQGASLGADAAAAQNGTACLGFDAAAAQNGTACLDFDAAAAQNGTDSLGSDATAALKNERCVRDTGTGLTLWQADLEVSVWEV